MRQILATGVRLIRDKASAGDLKLLNSALKEMRHAMHVFRPFERVRKVAVFGSARTEENEPAWTQAHEFSGRVVEAGWMVITGAGPGIMEAAQGGAGRKASFGVNIRLPFEQEANATIAGDKKLINFRFFFTRKVTFVKESHAIALFPGGFGTHDEGFEALTLVQTGKSQLLPIVFIDEPGGTYWHDWDQYVRGHLCARGLISSDDLNLYKVTDNIDDALGEIMNFYSNYHSSRYVHDELVLRVRRAPDDAVLERMNEDFTDILTGGRIRVTESLPDENGDAPGLPRVGLHFNRRDIGRLRLLVDQLNDLVPETAPTDEASPPQILGTPLSDGAEEAEGDDLPANGTDRS